MKRWRIHPSDAPLPAALVAEVLAGVGTPALAAHFLRVLQPQLPATFCTVFAVGASGAIETVSAASSYGQTAERTAERYVAQRYDRVDPHMVWLAARARPQRRAQLWLGHHVADELADADYRAACYGEVGIRERASVLILQPSGQRAAVSVYRSLAQPEFSDADFVLLESQAGLLADAAAAHGRITQASGRAVEPVFAARRLTLSVREREVIDQLLAGHSAKQAAQNLGVALSTVRTHQYRAFRRLGIRTLKELLRGAGAG